MPKHDKPSDNYTRRQFLQGSLATLATTASVPAFLASANRVLAEADALNPNIPGLASERVLVVIQLSGGNDGLNTVIPYANSTYYEKRKRIAVPDKDILKLDGISRHASGLGLHPALQPLHDLIGNKQAAIINGVGYPNPNRSHFVSMDIWHRGDALTQRGYGWLGKAFDHERELKTKADHSMDVISIGGMAPLATEGRRAKPIAFERQDAFRWIPGTRADVLDKPYEKINSAGNAAANPQNPADFLRRTAVDAQIASDRVRKAASRKPETSFPGHQLARQLQLVANMIAAELPTRVYYVAMGGFDTHAGQSGRHNYLLKQFAESVAAFQAELNATGQADRVVTFAFSEFGRRVSENASGGTDHGAAGPSFVIGNPIRSGVMGDYPSLTDLERGDLKYTVDFRHLYAGLLGPWLQLDIEASLGEAYKPANLVRV